MMGLRLALLTVGGLGRLGTAPGTWGSAATVVLVFGLLGSGSGPATVNAALLAVAAAFSIVCVALGRFAEAHFGRTDPSEVVADETAGQAVAMLWLPWAAPAGVHERLWMALAALTAFVAFRLFDVLKPPPIYSAQKLPAGWGILADDLLAGAAALGVAQLLTRVVYPALI